MNSYDTSSTTSKDVSRRERRSPWPKSSGRARSSRMIRASRERSSEQPVEQREVAHHFAPFFQFALVLPIALTTYMPTAISPMITARIPRLENRRTGVRRGHFVPWPSRPGELHPGPLTDPDMNLSIHPARATLRRLPPSAKTRSSSGCPLTPSWRG